MVEIRSFFTDWHKVTDEEALKYARSFYRRITMPIDRVAYVNRFVRGVQYTEQDLTN